MKATGQLTEFEFIGRKLPTEMEPVTRLYKMKIFVPNINIVATSRIWFSFRQLKKIKKTTGQIVLLKRAYERTPIKITNFGIWMRCNSRSGTHNVYREYRDFTIAGALTQCYREMARYRARAHAIVVFKVEVTVARKWRRKNPKQFRLSLVQRALLAFCKPRTYFL